MKRTLFFAPLLSLIGMALYAVTSLASFVALPFVYVGIALKDAWQSFTSPPDTHVTPMMADGVGKFTKAKVSAFLAKVSERRIDHYANAC